MTSIPDKEFYPSDPEIVSNPYPHYEWLRQHDPVHFVRDLNTWVITKYDDVRRVLLDQEAFAAVGPLPPERISPVILATVNPPDHTRLRKAISMHFKKRAVEELRSTIEPLARERVDRLVAQGGGEFVENLATPIPLAVIAQLLGVPEDYSEDLRQWADALMDVLAMTSFGMPREWAPHSPGKVREFYDFINELVQDRAREIVEEGAREEADIILSMIEQGRTGVLTETEIKSLAVFLLVAGHETTVNTLASGFLFLATAPDVWELVRNDVDLVPAFVEEVLRLESPIQRTARVTTQDVELSGRRIPEGSRVLAYIGSANRDAEHFPEPDRLDVYRERKNHLAFGWGIHMCLGARLARLEADIVFRTLIESDVGRPRVGNPPPRWRSRPEPRCLEHLWLSLE